MLPDSMPWKFLRYATTGLAGGAITAVLGGPLLAPGSD
jgi:hypothetical protein